MPKPPNRCNRASSGGALRSLRGNLLVSLAFLALAGAPAFASPLSDIPAGHWAKQAVETLSAKGFITGFTPDVFEGSRPATRYETAVILTRLLVFMQKEKLAVPPDELQIIKDKLADYREQIDTLGLSVENLEDAAAALQSRISRAETATWNGEFHNRTMAAGITGNLGSGIGQDTQFTLSHLNRPYDIFPVQAGENSTSLGYLNLSAKLDDAWKAGGRIAAYDNAGQSLNGLAWGGTPPLFSNPFSGYSAGNLKTSLDQVYVKKENNTLKAEVGSVYPEHSPSYFYSGTPNLTEEGPDFLPAFGGRLEADMKPYLFISKAYSEIYAGKLAQGSPWQTQVYGANAGVEALGISIGMHWMAVQNDPADMAAGTSGLIANPVNGGGGWLDPLTLNSIAVGPQKEKALGVDFSIQHDFRGHPVVFRLAYAHSDYKPDTNSSNNAGGELYDLLLKTQASENFTIGAEYLDVDPKYSPFILPFALPSNLTTSTFPWGQWPFPVDFKGYYTLQNAQGYPQNRQGAKTFFEWTFPRGKIAGSYRRLSQKDATQLSLFNNDADLQSIGFYEPLFTASGTRPQTFPNGLTRDWTMNFHYDLQAPLALEILSAGTAAKRFSGDANDIDFTGWMAQAGLTYSWRARWKFNLAYDLARTDGRLLASPAGAPNDTLRDSGELFRINYILTAKSDVFFRFLNLDHTQVPGSLDFHMLQFLTGLDQTF